MIIFSKKHYPLLGNLTKDGYRDLIIKSSSKLIVPLSSEDESFCELVEGMTDDVGFAYVPDHVFNLTDRKQHERELMEKLSVITDSCGLFIFEPKGAFKINSCVIALASLEVGKLARIDLFSNEKRVANIEVNIEVKSRGLSLHIKIKEELNKQVEQKDIDNLNSEGVTFLKLLAMIEFSHIYDTEVSDEAENIKEEKYINLSRLKGCVFETP